MALGGAFPTFWSQVVPPSCRCRGTTSRPRSCRCCLWGQACFLTDRSIWGLHIASQPACQVRESLVPDVSSSQDLQSKNVVRLHKRARLPEGQKPGEGYRATAECQRYFSQGAFPRTPDHLGQLPKARGWWQAFPQEKMCGRLWPANNPGDKRLGAVGGRCGIHFSPESWLGRAESGALGYHYTCPALATPFFEAHSSHDAALYQLIHKRSIRSGAARKLFSMTVLSAATSPSLPECSLSTCQQQVTCLTAPCTPRACAQKSSCLTLNK